MSESTLELRSGLDSADQVGQGFADEDERHYLFFHTIVFEAEEWPADQAVA